MSRPNPNDPTARRRGLTIVELVIGVAIVAVLTAVAVPQYLGYVERTELKRAITDIRMLETLIDRFHDEMGSSPDSLLATILL